jgi:hypothetical protein
MITFFSFLKATSLCIPWRDLISLLINSNLLDGSWRQKHNVCTYVCRNMYMMNVYVCTYETTYGILLQAGSNTTTITRLRHHHVPTLSPEHLNLIPRLSTEVIGTPLLPSAMQQKDRPVL